MSNTVTSGTQKLGAPGNLEGPTVKGKGENIKKDVKVKGQVKGQGDSRKPLPTKLHALYEDACKEIPNDAREKVKQLLIEYEDVFSKDDFDIGNVTAVEHQINTGEAAPIKQRLRRTPLSFVQEEEAHLKKMLDVGVIHPSTSEWASAPVLIRKKDGSMRWCIDYRALNDVTVKDVFPLPLINECLDTLYGNEWFTKLDATFGYWQVKVAEEDQKKTAFLTKYGLFEFSKMSFGLCNAPATFARLMNLVLTGLTWDMVLAFLDDILVLGANFDQHLRNLERVLARFREHGLKLKPGKCELFKKRVEFLGHTVSKEGVEVADKFIEVVKEWPVPSCKKEVQKFLGFINYHRSFIPKLSEMAVPLYELTGKKEFVWGPEQQKAFEELRSCLVKPPILCFPNHTDTFVLDCDASYYAMGCTLSQVVEGQERVIAYASSTIPPECRNYCTTRKELLAVVKFTNQFKHYLIGKKFIVRTDHSSLTWLLKFKNPQGQIARWIEQLSQFHMIVQHRPGSQHVNADALSRLKVNEPCQEFKVEISPEKLPCGGCKHCMKAHRDWHSFATEVDDTVDFLTTQVKGINMGGGEISSTKLHIDATGSVAVLGVSKAGNGVWMSGYNTQEMVDMQRADPNFQILIEWLERQQEPGNELLATSPAIKHYWVNRNNYFIDKDGLLWERSEEIRPGKWMVPSECKDEILRLNHDIPLAGHQGIDRTRERVKSRYQWFGLTADVKRYVKGCGACNRNKKASKKAKAPLSPYNTGQPLQRIHIDFLGPLPKTKKGNEYILMITDHFTKWVECFPLPSQTAEQTAETVVNEFFCRFGCPFEIMTDQGRNFESRLFQSLCTLLEIHKSRTTSYHPESNGQVERMNRTLMDALRCYVDNKQDTWDQYLPHLACALRTSVNRDTGFTPFKMMFGREMNIPCDLMYRLPPSKQTGEDYEDYVLRLKKSLEEQYDFARKNMGAATHRMKKDHDLRVNSKEYEVNDVVYILDSAQKKGVSKKLQPTWKGPGVIIEKKSSYVYKVKLPLGNTVINHDRMKLCEDRVLPRWVERFLAEGDVQIEEEDDTLYCYCKQRQGSRLMIGCDSCGEWYHADCLGLSKSQIKKLGDFFCPECKQSEARDGLQVV